MAAGTLGAVREHHVEPWLDADLTICSHEEGQRGIISFIYPWTGDLDLS